MNAASSEDADMDDIEKRVEEIIGQYGDLTQGGDAKLKEFKKTVQAFIKNGPGMPQQRRQALLRHMQTWDRQYRDFLLRPNG
jgi:hypothetical protein